MTATTHFREMNHPTHQEIARLAYSIYLAEGKPAGRAVQHWLRAEKELRLPAESPNLPVRKTKVRVNNRLAAATY